MKPLLAALAMTTALTLPGLALARPVTFVTQMQSYGGPGAYLAFYVTDAKGDYAGSLWMAGGKAKYYKHLRDWAAATGNDVGQVAGITGASVGSGRSLEISLDLNEALFDADYVLHIDAAVEEMRDSPNEIAVPLTAAGAGQSVSGRSYISAFSYSY